MNLRTVANELGDARADIRSSSRSSHAVSLGGLSDYLALTKPRVMGLAVFTAFVGVMVAPGRSSAFVVMIAIAAIAVGAGAAGALNMWYDADIDAVMTRTAMRPIPRAKVSRLAAFVFGVALGIIAVVALALATNLMAAVLLACTILFYVVVYTAWLKRSTRQNIVIGGAAGALPPVIGWAATTGEITLQSITLFLIIFLWTPAHFWALALNRRDDYARAGVPMLPVVAGRAATTRQILIYTGLLVLASELPCFLRLAGAAYGAIAAICGAQFLALAFRLNRSTETDRHAAHRLFVFSIFYLLVLFAALLIDHIDGSFPRMRALQAHHIGRPAHAGLLADAAGSARGLIKASLSEV